MLVINCVQYEQGQSVYRLYKYALQCIVLDVGAEGVSVYSVSLLVVRVVSVSVILFALPVIILLVVIFVLYSDESLFWICLKRRLQENI